MISILKHITNGTAFYLIDKESFIVGRKESDFLIQDDQSISRRHAKLTRKDKFFTITDLGSKYKTFRNNMQLERCIEIPLATGDKIDFGVMNSKYIFETYTIVTSGTRLNATQKGQVKNSVAALGGEYSETWHDGCSHLTVHEVTLTIKILQALIDKKPIVKPSYWSDFLQNAKSNRGIPDVRNYMPPMAEALLNKIELQQDLDRSHLFSGKMFIFSKEQLRKSLEDVIRKTGGVSYSWEKKPMSLEDILNSPKEILIIQSADPIEDPTLNELIDIMKKKGKRPVPQQELALAVVLGSCEKHCNPNYNKTAEIFKVDYQKSQTQQSLVSCTQSEDLCRVTDWPKEEVVIPDTFENSLPSQVSNTRIPVTSVEIDHNIKETHNQNKRPNPEKIQEIDSVSKRFKTETDVVSVEKIGDGFISKATTPKRKAEADVVKSEEKVNPFASLKKRRTDTSTTMEKAKNPFARMVQNPIVERNTTTENIFEDTLNKRRTNNKKECDNSKIYNRSNENKTTDKSVDFSGIPLSNSKSGWTSKKSGSFTETKFEPVDTEMQAVIDLFHKTIVAETLNYSTRQQPMLDRTNDSSKAKNFKKFSKQSMVKTRTPYKTSLMPVDPDNSIDIVDNRTQFANFDEENKSRYNMSERKAPTERKAPKKFKI